MYGTVHLPELPHGAIFSAISVRMILDLPEPAPDRAKRRFRAATRSGRGTISPFFISSQPGTRPVMSLPFSLALSRRLIHDAPMRSAFSFDSW
jgi:hypothetical protein